MQNPWVRRSKLLPVLVLSLASACSDDGGRPTAPPSTAAHHITGAVRLTARLADVSGNPTGAEVISNASGIKVFCRHGGGLDSAFTVGGSYSFQGVPASPCTVYVAFSDGHRAAEVRLDMPAHEHHEMEDLEIAHSDGLSISPNPIPHEGSGIEFTAVTSEPWRIAVRDMAGNVVWEYGPVVSLGFNHIHWMAIDRHGHEVAPGLYWTTVEVDGAILTGIALWHHEHDSSGDANCGHINAAGLAIAHHDERLATCMNGECTGDLTVAEGETSHGLDVLFLRPDHTSFTVADTCSENSMTWQVADTTYAALRSIAGRPWRFRVEGKQAGTTSVVLRVWHDDHIHFTSPEIPIVVTEP